jgi:hypothetical protein
MLGSPVQCRKFEEEIHSLSVTSNLASDFNSLHHCPSTGKKDSALNAALPEKIGRGHWQISRTARA